MRKTPGSSSPAGATGTTVGATGATAGENGVTVGATGATAGASGITGATFRSAASRPFFDFTPAAQYAFVNPTQ